ncbi:uncharacterized protein MONBRDRAFT_23233 [Monosiga brevicollis MX1]|uniref:Uncharacterized protein n=1 Tax=Monosiga brevicollis TaxID=81824 RepID=A9URK3_MONBE|nr:uncharacterized protein MONBRDRAFT_23233 [Monosiga brevicollis MX1]EDQ92257.1 predicted protein [Monosiga brevicollis MX1]|eukprot:XP_001743543.1 hypothetical protein [Monosiga brevicollis MX1]
MGAAVRAVCDLNLAQPQLARERVIIKRLFSALRTEDSEESNDELDRASPLGPNFASKPLSTTSQLAPHLLLDMCADAHGSELTAKTLGHLLLALFVLGHDRTAMPDALLQGPKGTVLGQRRGSLSALTGRPRPQVESDAEAVQMMKAFIDAILRALMRLPISLDIAQAMCIAMVEARAFATARQYVASYCLEWCQRGLTAGAELNSQVSDAVEQLLLLCVTDVWSAIRKASAVRMGNVLGQFTLAQLLKFYEALVEACEEESTWQEVDGALLGIANLLRKFVWVPFTTLKPDMRKRLSDDSGAMTGARRSGDAQFLLCYGSDVLPHGLPSIIEETLPKICNHLLKHQQLTVRENASKAFAGYLSRSKVERGLVVLDDLVAKLQHLDDEDRYRYLPHFEAEGLLDVCVTIIKQLPPGFLLPNWPAYFRTFKFYLGHPASTVRQACSLVFKHIIARDASNPIISKLVLQGLTAHWPVKTAVSAVAEAPLPSLAWEAKEGRLLAYDLILRFLISNHINYLFPTMLMDHQYAIFTPGQLAAPIARPARLLDKMFLRPLRGHSRPTSQHGDRGDAPLTASFDLLTRLRSPPAVLTSGGGSQPRLGNSRFSLSPSRTTAPALPNGGSSARNDLSPLLGKQDGPMRRARGISVGSQGSHANMTGVMVSPRLQRRSVGRRPTQRSKFLNKSLQEAQTTDTAQPFTSPSRKKRLQATFSLLAATDVAPSSLIMQLRDLDLQLDETTVAGSVGRSSFEAWASPARFVDQAEGVMMSPISGDLDSQSRPNTPRRHRRRSSVTLDLPVWVDTSRFCELPDVLFSIAAQTFECMHLEQFELQRMAAAILPLLSDVIRWFHYPCLDAILGASLMQHDNAVVRPAALMLRHSLGHLAWLRHYTSQHRELSLECQQETREVMTNVLASFNANAKALLELLDSCRRHFDLLSIEVIELSIMALAVVPPGELDMGAALAHEAVQALCAIHARAFPDSPFSDMPEAYEDLKFEFEGPLSCLNGVLAGLSDATRARRVCKRVYETAASYLPAFVDACEVGWAQPLLAPLLHIHGLPGMDDFAAKALFDALCRLLDKMGARYHTKPSAVPHTHGSPVSIHVDDVLADTSDGGSEATMTSSDRQAVQDAVALVEQQILLWLDKKGEDAVVLRRSFELALLCILIDCNEDFSLELLQFLANLVRRNRPSEREVRVQTLGARLSEIAVSGAGLDVSLPTVTESDDDSDSDDDALQSSLNRSGMGKKIAGVCACIQRVPGDNDESDGWDSWDEEEKHDAALLKLAKDYTMHMSLALEAAYLSQRTGFDFESQLEMLSPMEASQLRWALQTAGGPALSSGAIRETRTAARRISIV